MFVHEFLEQSAKRLPAKTALVCGGERYTYSELDSLANQFAHGLRALGVSRGDRVATCLQNSVEAVVGIFGALKAGAVFVPIHPSTKQEKLSYILNNCQAKVLLADVRSDVGIFSNSEPNVVPSLRQLIYGGKQAEAKVQQGGGGVSFDSFLEGQADSPSERQVTDEDLACLIYTSGSTGEPKGVMSDHGNVVFAAASIISYIGNTESDVVLNVLPLSFDYGLYQLLMTFRFGGTLVLERSFTFPAAVLNVISQEKVTGFPGVPTIFTLLLQMDLSRFDLSSLRYLTNTAAALPVSHILEIKDKFPLVELFSMYGLTETKRTLYLPPAELEQRPGSVGIPIPGTEAWLEDESGNRLGFGGQGELVVSGRHVMRGYWEAPELSAERFRPGKAPGERLCYTGDVFSTDEAGYFYFIGRKDDIIKCRGEKVAPKEIENALYALSGVMEVAVIGVVDSVLGQAIKAFIVQNGDFLTEKSVLAHCRKHLEDMMIPKFVEFRDELPKTTTGKIDKKGLV